MFDKVSAIVSAYFAEEYLQGRIDNLMEQEPRPEIIVVLQFDSPEAQIMDNYGYEAHVTRLYTTDVPTVASAWNIGIKASTGKYITNSNCDDRLLPGALAKLIQVLDDNPDCAVAYGNQNIVKEIDGEVVGKYEWAEGNLEKLLLGCFLGPMPVWRKSVHDKYGYFDETFKSAHDYEFWLRLSAGKEKFYHVREVIGNYLDRHSSVEHRQKILSIWETARARALYRKGVKAWSY